MADALKGIAMERLETINPFTLAPCGKRVQTVADGIIVERIDADWTVRIAVSILARNGVVGVGGAVQLVASVHRSPKLETFSSTLGMRSEQNLYSGELAAIAHALNSLPKLRFRSIAVL